MNLSIQEVDHIIKALKTMSNHDIARSREMISNGVTNHDPLIQRLKDHKLRLSGVV